MLKQLNAFSDQVGVPEDPVLLRQRHQLTVAVGSRRGAGLGQQHESKETRGLGVAGKPLMQFASKPDRLRSQ